MQSEMRVTEPIVVEKDCCEANIIRLISEALGTEISESADMFSMKMTLFKKFFGDNTIEVKKCEGKALATAIGFYLEKVDKVNVIICSLGFNNVLRRAVLIKQ